MPAKLKSYLIHVNGALCIGLRFARQEWVHEITLLLKELPIKKKKLNKKKKKKKKEWCSQRILPSSLYSWRCSTRCFENFLVVEIGPSLLFWSPFPLWYYSRFNVVKSFQVPFTVQLKLIIEKIRKIALIPKKKKRKKKEEEDVN